MKFKSKSSNIDHVSYDKESKTMQITFKNGSEYKYKGVGLVDYVKFKIAESHGKHLKTIAKKYKGVKHEK